MITKESVVTSVGLAEALGERGVVAMPKPNTVLAELVRYTNSAVVDTVCSGECVAGQNYYDPLASTVEDVTSGTMDAPSLHDQCMDSMVPELSKAVIAHLSFARNIVKPLVTEYAEGVTTYLTNFKAPTAADKFCVEICDVPELLEDESFADTLGFYDNKSPIAPDFIPTLGPKTAEEELLQLLMIGDKDADEAIVAWYSRKGENFFLNIWENFFRARQDSNPSQVIMYEDVLASDVFVRADIALALYLFAVKLFDAVDESAKGMNLNAYKNMIAQTRDFAGCILVDVLRRVDAYEKTKILVISTDPDKQAGKVFGKNYRPWLETGGCPETILGLIVSGKRLSTQTLIDDAKEDLHAQWRAYTVFHTAAESNKQFDYFKDALRLKFRALMNDLNQEEKTYIDSTKDYFDKVEARLDAEINQLKVGDMDDIYVTAMKLMCRARFYYTDAEMILSDIIEACKVNPNIDVREAALIATCNYVFDYLADQITLVEQ